MSRQFGVNTKVHQPGNFRGFRKELDVNKFHASIKAKVLELYLGNRSMLMWEIKISKESILKGVDKGRGDAVDLCSIPEFRSMEDFDHSRFSEDAQAEGFPIINRIQDFRDDGLKGRTGGVSITNINTLMKNVCTSPGNIKRSISAVLPCTHPETLHFTHVNLCPSCLRVRSLM